MSPAEQLLNFLVFSGEAVLPLAQNALPWTGYVGRMPTTPDDAICLYDYDAKQDGRIQATGEVIEHPSVQIRIRSRSYSTGWNKARTISRKLDGLRNHIAPHSDFGSKIVTVVRKPIFPIGEEDTTKRHLFTINTHLTII